jgi:predicted nucleotidyltransferase
LGATALYVFGSAARDELGPGSDVDIFIDYDPEGPFSFVELIQLQWLLADILQREIDLTTRGGIHPMLKEEIEHSSIRVL